MRAVAIVDRRPGADRLLARLDLEPDGLPARLLAPLGDLWALGARIHRRIRPDLHLPPSPPSLGVGNLRAGGTGKTPVVEDLGRRLRAEGRRVAVLTRGWRSSGGGDEPGWLEAAGLEVVVDPDRGRGFGRAVADGADRILLDDALQTRHRPRWTVAIILDRDLGKPPRPFPAGLAREGALPALARADALLVRREAIEDLSLPGRALGFRLLPEGFLTRAGQTAARPEGRGVLFSGLARPESFERDARTTGIGVVGIWREPDHWTPSAGDAKRIREWATTQGADWILLPEKNLSRFRELDCDLPAFALRSGIRWDNGADPLAWLRGRGIDV